MRLKMGEHRGGEVASRFSFNENILFSVTRRSGSDGVSDLALTDLTDVTLVSEANY